jgi:3-oxoacyl-[acyl-carrier protein] reductase
MLAGKTAVVTGAASGFGRGIAEDFTTEGARVHLIDIDAAGAEAVATGLGASHSVADVSKGAEVARAFDEAVAALGDIDILVNNAGWSHPNQPLLETDFATFKRVYEINVDSIFHFAQAAVPHWRARGQGGVMINVGSTAGLSPRPGLSWYNGSKGAVNVLTQSLAVELAPDNIRVNAIAPVMGETALLETFMGMPDTPDNRARFLATIPLGRLSKPRDIAQAAVYLASDRAEFLTGVILPVDGGRTI